MNILDQQRGGWLKPDFLREVRESDSLDEVATWCLKLLRSDEEWERKLDVSRAQIQQWKSGEIIPYKRARQIILWAKDIFFALAELERKINGYLDTF